MRIQRLEIERWGHFHDFPIDLLPPGGGLCLLTGENEAGKTTLREGLRALLFGIPENSAFAFRFGASTLALRAHLVLADGEEIEVRRRRGRGNTLTGKVISSGVEFDDAAFRARLRHPSEDLFVNVFGFSQEELAQGGEILRQADLRNALAGASMGAGVNPHELIVELAEAASALFKSGGHVPRINKRAAIIREKMQSLHRAPLRGDDYQRLVNERAAADQRAAELALELVNLRRRAALVNHLVEAIPARDELRALREERRHLVIPAGLPPSAGEEHANFLRERATQITVARDLDGKIDNLSEQLRTLTIDGRLLDARTAIDDLYRRSGAISKACVDGEKLKISVAQQRPDLEARVEDVRPGWTLAELSQFRLSVQERHAFEQTVTLHDQLAREADGAREQLKKLATALDLAHRALAELPSRIETAELEAVIDGWSGYCARAAALTKQEAEQSRLERRLATARRKLDPPWEGADVASLPVPPEEEVATAARHNNEIEQATVAQDQRKEEHEREVERLRSEQQIVEAGGPVPSEDELRRLRAHRDAGWSVVRHALAGEDVAAATTEWAKADDLVSAYEAAVDASDRHADELRLQADTVARRDECLRAMRQRTADLEQVRQRLKELKSQSEAARLAWVNLWARCGFAPLTPPAMTRWLQDYRVLVDLAAQSSDAAAQCEQLGNAQREYEQRLTAAVPGVVGAPDALHAEARQRLASEKERRATETSLKQRVGQDEELRVREADRLAAAEAALTTWRDGWRQTLHSLGLSVTLEPAAAQRVLQEIEILRRDHKAWREHELRVEHIERDRQSFEAEVTRLCHDVGFEPDGGFIDRTVQELHKRLNAAVEANRKRDDLTERLAEARKDLGSCQRRLDECDRALSALRERAGAVDDDAFRVVAQNATRAQEIDEDIASRERIVVQLRGATPAAEFETQLDAAEALVLEAERKDLEAHVATLSEEQLAVTGKAAVATASLKATDDMSVAATLLAEIESNRAALREEVREYIMLTIERVLLEKQVKTFQEQHQPGLLAELSKLFSAITGGRYPRVFQPLGSDALRIADAQGGEKAPEQLSKGTREQLYLALRLAYMLQYCRSGEPLPIVLDDALVHFDARRAEQAMRAIFALGREFQVLFLTCHSHLVELARRIEPEVHVVELPAVPA